MTKNPVFGIEVKDSEKIYVYKLIADNGGAPCVQDGVLSLSICKPHIRQSAQVGDWIIGFGGKSIPDLRARLIYIAQVTTVLDDGGYYSDQVYYSRRDCIYRKCSDGYYGVKNDFHDPVADLAHDVGEAPNYDRARNLLSTQFVYFGGNRDVSIEDVRDLYDNLPRDYVKFHPETTRKRWEAFILSVIEKYNFGTCYKPTHPAGQEKCYDTEDEPQIYRGSCSS